MLSLERRFSMWTGHLGCGWGRSAAGKDDFRSGLSVDLLLFLPSLLCLCFCFQPQPPQATSGALLYMSLSHQALLCAEGRFVLLPVLGVVRAHILSQQSHRGSGFNVPVLVLAVGRCCVGLSIPTF